MTANAVDFGSAFLRAAGLAVLAVGAILAFIFAFAAAIIVGLMVTGAAVALQFWPRRRGRAGGSEVLEARRTPAGWVVETVAKRRA